MIYRIHHDENLLMHVAPPVESMRKLGEEHDVFAFNSEPKSCRMYLIISAGNSCLKRLAKH